MPASALRSIARGIHPAILDERGLDAALSALVAGAPVPVDVSVRLSRRPGRRLAAVDGSLSVESPSGGPTTVTAVIPCGS